MGLYLLILLKVCFTAFAMEATSPDLEVEASPQTLKDKSTIKQEAKEFDNIIAKLIDHNDNINIMEALEPYQEEEFFTKLKYRTFGNVLRHFYNLDLICFIEILKLWFPSYYKSCFCDLASQSAAIKDLKNLKKLLNFVKNDTELLRSCHISALESFIIKRLHQPFCRQWLKYEHLLNVDDLQSLLFTAIRFNDRPFLHFLINHNMIDQESKNFCLVVATYFDQLELIKYLLDYYNFCQPTLALSAQYWAKKKGSCVTENLFVRKACSLNTTFPFDKKLLNFEKIPASQFLVLHNDIIKIFFETKYHYFKIKFHLSVEPFYPPVLRVNDRDEMTGNINILALKFVEPYLAYNNSLFFVGVSDDKNVEYYNFTNCYSSIADVALPIKAFLELEIVRGKPLKEEIKWRAVRSKKNKAITKITKLNYNFSASQ